MSGRDDTDSVLTQLFTAKVATIAAAALLTAGTAAAATGNLPNPLHHSVASTSSHADVAHSESTDESTTTTTETPTSTTTTSTTVADAATTTTSTTPAESASDGAVGPDANGPAKHGLCTAYFAGHAKNPNAVAFRNLINAATASGVTVEAFCAPTTTTTSVTTDADVATADDADATDDATDTHGHGQSGSTPGATAPGRMSSPSHSHGKP